MIITKTEANMFAGVIADLTFIAGAMSMHDAARARLLVNAEIIEKNVAAASLHPLAVASK